MIVQGYKYRFLSQQALTRALTMLSVARLAAEGLHGESRVRMDLDYAVDHAINSIAISDATQVGADVAAIFTRFITQELGQNKFLVHQVEQEVQA